MTLPSAPLVSLIERFQCTPYLSLSTLTREEVLWLYQEGASYVYPDEWEKFIEPIPRVERGDFMSAYYRRLTGDDEKVRLSNIVVAESLHCVMYAKYSQTQCV